MTPIHTISPRTGSVRARSTDRSGPRLGAVRPGGVVPVAAARPVAAADRATALPRHRRHRCPSRRIRRRPVTLATTVGLALVAGLITLWLGLVAHFGQALNGDTAGSAAQRTRPARRRAGRAAGSPLQDVAHRVAPDAPARQVAERIRELNDLNSPAVAAGQTLIAPVG